MSDKSYSEKLTDPRWQKLRLYKMHESGWKCEVCGDEKEELNVHHREYRKNSLTGENLEPWQYKSEELQCLCRTCHTIVHLDKEKLKKYIKPLAIEIETFIVKSDWRLEPRFAEILKQLSGGINGPDTPDEDRGKLLELQGKLRQFVKDFKKKGDELENSGWNFMQTLKKDAGYLSSWVNCGYMQDYRTVEPKQS